jgi:uncharacterized protein (TIGR00159 family)
MIFNFGLKDIIDIVLVAIILYQLYRLTKGTGAVNLFLGVLSFVIFWFLVTYVFQMELLGLIMNTIMSLAPILLIIVFQEEIRRFFFMLGKRSNFHFLKVISNFFNDKQDKIEDLLIMQLVTACRKMSHNKVGALIILERNVALTNYIETGEIINADVNSRLIENIFFKNSPLHDGAMIISGNRIKAAGCILPVSHNPKIPKHLGLRHRSALGISEQSDAIAIIVSEETGRISVANNGELKLNLTPEQLESFLAKQNNK